MVRDSHGKMTDRLRTTHYALRTIFLQHLRIQRKLLPITLFANKSKLNIPKESGRF